MTRRRWEAAFLLGTVVVAALTVTSVRPADLGPFAAGVLGPLVVVGASVCVLSWPPRFDPPAGSTPDPGDAPRPPWRFAYLAPALVTAVAGPVLVADRSAGLPTLGVLLLVLFLGYLAMLLGAAVFLVVLLPLGQLLGWWRARLEGRTASPSVPLGALLVLALVGLGLCAGVAFDGLPAGPVGLVLATLAVVGIRPDSVVVAHPAWLLAARVSGLVLVAVAVGFVVQGRRTSDAGGTRR